MKINPGGKKAEFIKNHMFSINTDNFLMLE